MSLQPLEDRIIILPDEAPKQKGSILIPENVQEKLQPAIGTVVAVGPGKDNEHLSLLRKILKALNPLDESANEVERIGLNVGDRVHYGKYAGAVITHEGKDYLVIRYADVFVKR